MTAQETVDVLWAWSPYLAEGFGWNIIVSLLAMAVGTIVGLVLALLRGGSHWSVRHSGGAVTTLARNAPTFVMLFYLAYIIPTEFTLFGAAATFPAWIKAALALGIAVAGYVSDLPWSEWERLFAWNIESTVRSCRLAVARMRAAGGGSIVNMSSISGLRGDPGWAAYNTVKAAIINLTECLAWEVGGDGIRVNAVCPGPIASPRMIDSLPAGSDFVSAYNEAVALGRMGRPEEVAAAIAFLACEDASFVSGAHLVVDGGLTARTGQPIVPP